MNGGRFDFDDGGTFCGGWEEGKAHGHGICTGPDSQGEYAGAWHYGFEVSGIYTWPSGSTYMGQWQNGKRHGLGVEQRGRWIYKGEWTQGFKGRYGRREAINSGAHYLGTWSAGLHDGYGSEIYADGGSYKGQWLRGMRHGYGIRVSAPHGVASKHRSRSNRHASLTSLRSNNYDEYDENNMNLMDTTSPRSNKEKGMGAEERENAEMRGGFVLKARSSAPSKRRRSLSERSLAVKRTILSNLRITKQHSTGDIHQRVTSTAGSLRSSGSTISFTSDESDHHRHAHEYEIAPEDKIDPSTVETYKGEWKNDARAGYGVCERSDGLRYAGEWQDNKKHGYGVTFFKDGTKEEGRYKNNVLVCSTKRRGILFVRTSKLRERVETHLENAKRAAEIAMQRVDIALSRTMTAQERADASMEAAERAKDDADTARIFAAQFDPSFRQPGIDHIRQSRGRNVLQNHVYANHVSFESTTSAIHPPPSTSQYAHHKPSPSAAPTSYHQFNHKPHYPQNRTDAPHFQQQPANNRTGEAYYQKHEADMAGSIPSTSVANPMPYSMQASHNPDTSSILIGDNHSGRVNTSAERVQFAGASASTQHLDSIDESTRTTISQNSQATTIQQSQYPDTSNPIQQATDGASTSKMVGNSVGFPRQSTLPASGNPSNDPQSSKGGDGTPQMRLTPRRRGAQGSSTMSLSDDHFDQYTMSKQRTGVGMYSPMETSIDEGSMEARLRRNRPSLIRQSEVNDVNLNRRSTLASSRDRAPEPYHHNQIPAAIPYELNSKGPPVADVDRGSLPNLDELVNQGVYMEREEAARLASARRQEMQRLLEEQQLLQTNPLRYLYHPAFRNWLLRWKVPLLLLLGNILLLYFLVHLVNVDRKSISNKRDSFPSP